MAAVVPVAYGDEIEAKEKRRRANAAAEQKRAQIAADFADHVSDLINWMYRDLAHLEGEREDQAIRTVCDLRRAPDAEGR